MKTLVIIFIVGFVLFSAFEIWAFFSIRQDSKEGGYYFIGGINGGRAINFFTKHPNADRIYNKVTWHSRSEWNEEEIDELFSLGVKAVALEKASKYMLVITDEMALAYGKPDSSKSNWFGTEGQIYDATHKEEFLPCVRTREIKTHVGSYETVEKAKQKSVIGNAVAGAVIAGGVGAVVGAAHALDSNNKSEDKVVTHYFGEKSTGVSYSEFSFKAGNGYIYLDKVYLAPELRGKYYGEVSDIIRGVCNDCWK